MAEIPIEVIYTTLDTDTGILTMVAIDAEPGKIPSKHILMSMNVEYTLTRFSDELQKHLKTEVANLPEEDTA